MTNCRAYTFARLGNEESELKPDLPLGEGDVPATKVGSSDRSILDDPLRNKGRNAHPGGETEQQRACCDLGSPLASRLSI